MPADSAPHTQARHRDPEQVRAMFAKISRRYDLANHLLSAGLDILWRQAAARAAAQSRPSRVLDLACGSGDLWLALRKRLPNAEITGADFCEQLLQVAAAKGCSPLILADALALPFPSGEFDAVTIGFGFRNMQDYSKAAAECARVLRPGGALVILDFSLPRNPAVRFLYRLYLHRILPRVAGWATGDASAYEYLGGSIEQFPSGPAMEQLLLSNGFRSASARELTLGVVSLYTARR